MTSARLDLSREQVIAFRRRVGALDERLPAGTDSLRRAAWAGLQDSMPRAALLSIHARVEGADHAIWEDTSLVQLWGPRYQTYVVAARDLAVFSLGRLPEDERGRRRAEQTAEQIGRVLERGQSMRYGDAGRLLGVNANSLRYAATTGTLLIRWEGARQPTIRLVERPGTDPAEARQELARRYLHVFGPSRAPSFAKWAGIGARSASGTFAALEPTLVRVRTPLGEAWMLASDEPAMRAEPGPAAPARLLPSGDAFFLLQGDDRALLVPEEERRGQLWTPRVWPGALLVGGEVRGTWRRADRVVDIEPWGRLTPDERAAVEHEARGLPLPALAGPIEVRWAA